MKRQHRTWPWAKLLFFCPIGYWAKAAFLLSLLFHFNITPSTAQQEPQFTNYMFNTLVYNPGYAGSREYLSAVVLHRDQWFGWGGGADSDGRPVTQTFSVHSPVKKSVGLGINFVRDQIGARQTTFVNAIYAYRIKFGKGTLSMGIQAGAMSWSANWSELDFKDARELDFAFQGTDPSQTIPDIGAGVFFYNEKFYAGASLPHLAQFQLRSLQAEEKDFIRKWARQYRHFYFTGGGVIPLGSDNLLFKPSFLIKTVGFFPEFFKNGDLVREIGAPSTFDIDASVLFQKKFWLGLSFRSAFAAIIEQNGGATSSYDSVDLWTNFLFDNGFRIGFAFDYPLSEIQNYTTGSFEIMLGYDLFREVEKVNHPRYF